MRIKSVQVEILSAFPANPESPHYGSLCKYYPDLIKTAAYAETGAIVLVVDKLAGTRTFGILTNCLSKDWDLWQWENLSDENLARKLSDRIWEIVDCPVVAESFLQWIGVESEALAPEIRHV